MVHIISDESLSFLPALRKIFLGLLLVCLFTASGQAQTTSFASEKEAIREAVNNFLVGVGIEVTDLQSDGNGDDKKVTGKVSLFGMDNLELEGTMQSTVKVKDINIVFPDGASIDLEQLTKMVGDASLTDFLPAGFPSNTGLSIKNLELAFANNGFTLDEFGANFAAGSYSIPGFSAFSINGIDLNLAISAPTKASRQVRGTLSGNGKIGAVPMEVLATLSSNPEDIVFTSSMSNINLNTVLKTFVRDEEANNFLALVPDVFKSMELQSLNTSLQPATSTVSGVGISTVGDVEFQVAGGSGHRKTALTLGVAPPATFKFSEISGSLAPMDELDLNGTAFVISSTPQQGYASLLGTLKDEQNLDVKTGLNVLSSIKFGKDLADLLKVNQLSLRGSANKTFTAVSMDAALDLNLEFTEDVKMSEVVFGTRMSTTVPLVFSISGLVEATIGGDRLGFNAGFEMSPTDQQMKGEFFMEALQKQRGAQTHATTDASGNPIPPEWTEPFGIPGVGLQKIGASAGIDLKFTPIYLNELGLTGSVRLGTVSDVSKHIQGSGTIVVNVTSPIKSLLEIELKNMTFIAMIEAFAENHGIEGALRDALDSGVDEGKVLIVPVDGLEAFGKTYEKGIAFGGALSLGGHKGYIDFSLNEAGIAGKGALDPINFGDGLFSLTGSQTDKPQMSFALQSGKTPELFLDGKVSLLGLSSETTVLVNNTGFEFTTTGKILDEFEATLEAKAKSMSEDGSGFYVRAAMRNDLVEKLNKEITAAIDEATKDVKSTLSQNRRDLQNARNALIEVDRRIAKRAAEVASRRAADLQKMRSEAERALKEQKAVMNWHQSKIKSIQRDLNKLSGSNPSDWPEISALESAILFHKGAIETEKIAYDGYSETVKGLADIGGDFPEDVELTDLYVERTAKDAALTLAIAGVDVAKGVSVPALEAAKFIVDQSLGGLFDIKSAEFEGNFGVKEEYIIRVNFNVTFTREPYHFAANIDFRNPEASIGAIVEDLLAGKLLKKGFKSTFAKEIQENVVSSNDLRTVSIGLENIRRNPKALNTYWVTIETAPSADAGSRSDFVIDIYGQGSENYLKDLPLKKDLFASFEPGQSITFPIQTGRELGNIQKIAIRPVGGSSDNLIIRGISVKSKATGKTVHGNCVGCNITANKTLSFDGKDYHDYWVTISTNDTQNAGTDANVMIQLEGTRGLTSAIEVSEMYRGNAFERGELMEFPLSFENVGDLKNVIISGGSSIDNWIYGGLTIRNEKAEVLINYCNCPMDGGRRKLPLNKIDYYEDYRIDMKTKKGSIFNDYGTDSDVYFTLVGSQGKSNRVQGESFLRAKGSIIGENLYANGTSNFGNLTDRNVGKLQSIIVNNTGDDEWTFTQIRIKKGREVYASVGREFVVENGTITVPLKYAGSLPSNGNSPSLPVVTPPATGSNTIVAGKTYRLELRHSKKVLGIMNAKVAAGSEVVQYANAGKVTQHFQFIPQGAYYKIKPKTGKNLFFDVAGGSTTAGGKIILWHGTNNANQLFKLTAVGDGYYTISPKSNPKLSLDVPRSSTQDNVKIIQWTTQNSANQQFKLIEVD